MGSREKRAEEVVIDKGDTFLLSVAEEGGCSALMRGTPAGLL